MAKQNNIKISEVDISDLIPDDKNFNKGNEFGESLIEKSFNKFGAGRSVLIDKNNRLIAGNKSTEKFSAQGGQKVVIIETDGDTLVAVKRNDIDLDSSIGREMALADNASAKANIVFDAEVVEAELGEAICTEWGVELSEEAPEAEEDDFDVPEGGIETDIVLGDLFEIGEHRLLCGDSTDSDSVAKLMNGEKADLGLTDPPYNLGYDYATYDDNLTSEEYNDFIIGYASNLISFSEKQIITSGKQNVGYYYKNFDITEFAVWYAKNKMSGSKIANLGLCEPILFIGKFNRNARATDMFEFTVKQQKETGGHTCPKVMEFFSDLLNSYSDRLILDLFLGSGTTMVAAHQLKRKCYGMELDPKYCQVIVDRMRKLDPTIKIKRNGEDYVKAI